jgi:transposase
VYFEDEMRYGTRTACKKRWTRKGKRPTCKVKIGYEYGWLYVALCPQTGDMVASFSTNLDKDCFTMFTKQLEEHSREKKIPTPIVMIADGATAHQESCLPQQIKLVKLPKASPELNPVERFFQELRKPLSNQVFDNKQQVENYLERWVNQWKNDKEAIIKLTNFKWIKREI